MSDAAARKAARKKVFLRLGGAPKDLWGLALAPQNGGLMKRSDFAMFWDQLDTPQESTWMLGEVAQLINKQLESWKGGNAAPGAGNDPSNPAGSPSAASASSAASGSGGAIGLDSLLTTFQFLCLTQDLQLGGDKSKPVSGVSVKDIMDRWSKIESALSSSKNLANQHPMFTQAKEIYRQLNLRFDPRGEEALLAPLILACVSMYGSIREFERMMDVMGYSTIDDSVDLKGGESAFYYEYLKRLARDGHAISNAQKAAASPASAANPLSQLLPILQNIVTKLVTLPQQMKMSPKLAETSFCALMHMLRNYLTLHATGAEGATPPPPAGGAMLAPLAGTTFLRTALNTLQPFFMWPQPFGGITRELIDMMKAELVVPGTCVRARLTQEVHCTPYWDTDVPIAPGSGTPAPGQAGGELTSALFYIYAGDDRQAASFSHILDLKPFKAGSMRRPPAYVGAADAASVPALLTPTIQAMVLLNMLATEPSTAPGVEGDLALIRQCNGEQVYQLYRKAQSLLQAAAERPAESRDIRARGLADLRTQIKAAAAASDRRDLVRLPEKLSAPFTPSLPLVSHLSMPTATTGSFHFDPRDQWRMVGYKDAPFAHVPMAEHLGNLLNMYRDATRAQPLTLRLMLAGGDELLHQVLCAWCALRQTRPEVFEGLKPRFFVLPTQRNHLAAFMARHDAWYNRHVYVPSRSDRFLLPWVRPEDDGDDKKGPMGALSPKGPGAAGGEAEEDALELPPPTLFFRRLFESYAREASLTMDAQVWQCEGYVSAESEGLRPDPKAKVPPIPGPDQLTPFLQRVELGVMAAAAEFKRARKLPDSVRLEDIVNGTAAAARGFDFQNPTEIVVKFTKQDAQGRLTEVVTEEAAVYQSILLSSVPRRGDPTFPAAPTAPTIELAAKLHKSYTGNKQAALLGRKPALLSDPKQHVVEVEVWAANPNHTFGLLLDGQYFGPYYRVKLLPAFHTTVDAQGRQHTDGKRITFPLQHFFPMDV